MINISLNLKYLIRGKLTYFKIIICPWHLKRWYLRLKKEKWSYFDNWNIYKTIGSINFKSKSYELIKEITFSF